MVDALESTVCPDTVRAVADAVVRVVCPDTLRVPFEVSEVVAVIEPPVMIPDVSEVIKEVAALKRVVKKLVEVPLVVIKLVVEAFVAAKLLVTVALTKVEEVAKRFVIVVVASVDVPTTLKDPTTPWSPKKIAFCIVAFCKYALLADNVLVTVALTKVEDVAKRLVAVALLTTKSVNEPVGAERTGT